MKTKYLKNMSITDWFRMGSYSVENTSIIWNGFIRLIGWINKSLSWKVGCGNAVIVGVDSLTGMEEMYTLSEPLISYLCDYGIKNLDQSAIHE